MPTVRPGMNRRLTVRGRARRRQLMDFAAARFAEKGYHPTSVAEIVSGLHVGKGVFYWYFSSKEELFREILREAQQELRRRQQQAIENEADPMRRIELGIRSSMGWLEENRHLFTLFQLAASEERFSPTLRRGPGGGAGGAAPPGKEGIVSRRHPAAAPPNPSFAPRGVAHHLAPPPAF